MITAIRDWARLDAVRGFIFGFILFAGLSLTILSARPGAPPGVLETAARDQIGRKWASPEVKFRCAAC